MEGVAAEREKTKIPSVFPVGLFYFQLAFPDNEMLVIYFCLISLHKTKPEDRRSLLKLHYKCCFRLTFLQ